MAFFTNRESTTRRDCLRLGLSTLIGGGLIDALRVRGQAAIPDARRTSCILIWMDGGPSHYETFDPKPGAPAEIRGKFNPIATAVPGIHYSEQMKQLGRIADKIAIVRSIRHDQGNHGAGNHYMMTGAPPRIPVGCGAFVSFHPSMGAVAAHERGAAGGLPPYFSIPSMSRSGGPNFFGAKCAHSLCPMTPTWQASAFVTSPRRAASRSADQIAVATYALDSTTSADTRTSPPATQRWRSTSIMIKAMT